MYFPETMVAAAADRAACRALLRNGSRTFFAAAHLLPPSVREPATALYAFCRIADDAVDGEAAPADKPAALVRLHHRLDCAYRGEPLPLPADRRFADAVERFAIPQAIPRALLEGLSWDAVGRRYETLGDLKAYAARVAGTVGVMMAIVMGVRDEAALARACDLGVAMQLTNIARDVGEDARAGRLYLPVAWLREAGIDADEWLATPSFLPAIGTVVDRLLAEADRLYRASETGIGALPLSCRPGIHAARLLYDAIGAQVRRSGCNSVERRAVVSTTRKLFVLAGVLRPLPRETQAAPPMREASFLVEAGRLPERPGAARRAGLRGQVLWVLDLFERVEQRRNATAQS